MRITSVVKRLLGIDPGTVVEGAELDEEEDVVVVFVRVSRRSARRCGRCARRCRLYDRGDGRRR